MPTPWRREPVYMPKSLPPTFKPPSMSVFERLGIKPTPQKPAGGPSASDPFGFLGEKGYAKDWQLREFARKKAPYENLPGTYRKLGKKQREALMKELMIRSKEIARREGRQTYGISKEIFKKVIGRIESPSAPGGSELYKLHRSGKLLQERELKRKAQLWKKWAGLPK